MPAEDECERGFSEIRLPEMETTTQVSIRDSFEDKTGCFDLMRKDHEAWWSCKDGYCVWRGGLEFSGRLHCLAKSLMVRR